MHANKSQKSAHNFKKQIPIHAAQLRQEETIESIFSKLRTLCHPHSQNTLFHQFFCRLSP